MIIYYLTAHAQERLIQRSLRIEEIEKALTEPDYSYPGKQGELNFVKKLSKGKTIRVVAMPDKEKIKIITAVIMRSTEGRVK